MITYKLNSDNDIFVENGTFLIVFGVDQIAQDLETYFRVFQGELFYNTAYGIPYFQTLFQKPADKNLFDAIMRTAILSVVGVTSIVSYQSSIDTLRRIYSISFTASTSTNSNITQAQEFIL